MFSLILKSQAQEGETQTGQVCIKWHPQRDTDDTDRGHPASKDSQALEGETQAGQVGIKWQSQSDTDDTDRGHPASKDSQALEGEKQAGQVGIKWHSQRDTDDTDRGHPASKDSQALEGETQAGQRAAAFSRQSDSSTTPLPHYMTDAEKGEIWEREKNGARASQPRFFMPSVWLLWMLIQVKISAKCCSDCKTLSVGQIGCSFAVKNSSSNSLHWISPTPFGKWQLLCVVFKSWNGVSTSTEDLGPCVCPVILLLKVF